MAGIRTMEDFIRQRMTVDRSKRMSIILRPDGQFEASWVHADGRTATVEVSDDPANALWNSMVPFTMRRKLHSGREVVAEGDVRGIPDEIEDLLGDTPAPSTADEIEDLLA